MGNPSQKSRNISVEPLPARPTAAALSVAKYQSQGTFGESGDDENAFDKSAGCSQEQIFSPLQINKNYNDEVTPGFQKQSINTQEFGPFGVGGFKVANGEVEATKGGGIVPTISELDPYFPKIMEGDDQSGTGFFTYSDFNQVVAETDEGPVSNLNLRRMEKEEREAITLVRTTGLRGPLILSGWGFSVADKPVPSRNPGSSQSREDTFFFHPKVMNDRSFWKTGPVHLMWDDERQVWTGGYPMVMGVATTDIEAPESPVLPTKFTVSVLRHSGGQDNDELLTDFSEEEVEAYNFDPSLQQALVTEDRENPPEWPNNPSMVWVILIKLNYYWIPIYVGCPGECVNEQQCEARNGPPDDGYRYVCEDGVCEQELIGGGSEPEAFRESFHSQSYT